jgi:hypothetical protein
LPSLYIATKPITITTANKIIETNPKIPCDIPKTKSLNKIRPIILVNNPREAKNLCNKSQFLGLCKTTIEIETEKEITARSITKK